MNQKPMQGLLASAWLLVCVVAFAQPDYAGTIECEGIATVTAVPDYLEFVLKPRFTSTTLARATALANNFVTNLQQLLEAREMVPKEFEASPPIIIRRNGKVPPQDRAEVCMRVRLRYSISEILASENAEQEFATLCDKALGVAQQFRCLLEGPVLGVLNPEVTERAAIAKAIENAYPSGEACAQTMPARIYAVYQINVQGVTWIHDSERWEELPSLKGIQCRAKVRVTYLFTAGS